MQDVTIPVENIDAILEDFTHIRLYRDTSPAGAFSTQVGTNIALVEGQVTYTVTDADGEADHWYRFDFFNSSDSETSDLGPAFQSPGTTLRTLRIETAIAAGVGFKSACTSAGDVLELDDAALKDSGLDSNFLYGSWVYRPDAEADGDKVRRVAQFDTTDSQLVPTRAWTNAPADEEEYQVFNLLPPVLAAGASMSYDNVIRSALNKVWFVDQIEIGTGTDDGQSRFEVGGYPIGDKTIRRIMLRTYDATTGYPTDVDAERGGRVWEYHGNGHSAGYIELSPAPGDDEHVIVEVNRTDASLYKDTDVTLCPFDLALRACVVELFVTMNLLQPGKYAGELAAARAMYEDVAWRYRPSEIVRGI